MAPRCTGTVHHCNTCNKTISKKCWDDGHMAYCEAKSCSKIFNAYHGCRSHPYSDAWNLATKARYEGERLEDIIGRRDWELQGPPDLRDASVEDKLAALRKKYKHDEQEEPKLQRKQPKPSVKIGKYTKFLSKLEKTAKSRKYA
ncbi:hypothetical protein K490DRAFT_62285 [Saccharata proteae CBS 121410]|uniref:Uncharacterized protein n=1 Tax=Saccharata proteae CBS 121410 TaxID=1314787 RepID=A0A9P4M2J5_9PEZI|nr:hypothetical protein K490DRAFT_62285 [Saccharata proteae CBS 121410]